MQIAIDTRTVEKDDLFRICVGRIACSMGARLPWVIKLRTQQPLMARIRRFYSVRLFHARARLDVPTYESTNVQRQLDDASTEILGRTVAWGMLEKAASLVRAGMQLVAQSLVLLQVLRGQRDGLLLAALTMTSQSVSWIKTFNVFQPSRGTLSTRPAHMMAAQGRCFSVGGDDDEPGLYQDGGMEASHERCLAPQGSRCW